MQSTITRQCLFQHDLFNLYLVVFPMKETFWITSLFDFTWDFSVGAIFVEHGEGMCGLTWGFVWCSGRITTAWSVAHFHNVLPYVWRVASTCVIMRNSPVGLMEKVVVQARVVIVRFVPTAGLG